VETLKEEGTERERFVQKEEFPYWLKYLNSQIRLAI